MSESHGLQKNDREVRTLKRAMLVNYSVSHLAMCGRIFDQRSHVNAAIKWVRDRIADGTLIGKPRKAEGIEYVADCLRIHRAYLAGRNARDGSEDKGIARAQAAIAPRGGARTGLATTDVRNRLFALSVHLLSMTEKLGVDSPFSRLFKTMKDLERWVQMLPYGYPDSAAWDELAQYGTDTPLSSMTFGGAARLYSMTLPPLPDGNAAETRADDTMTDADVQTANTMGEGSVNVPAVEWWNIPTITTPVVVDRDRVEIVTTRSSTAYNTRNRALAFGRREYPNASETDRNAPEYLTAEQTAPPVRAGGEMRWVWVLRQRLVNGEIVTWIGTDIPAEQIERTPTPTGRPGGDEFFLFIPTSEPEQVGEYPIEDTDAAVQQLRESRIETGGIIVRRRGDVDVVFFIVGNFERRVMPPATGGDQPTATA